MPTRTETLHFDYEREIYHEITLGLKPIYAIVIFNHFQLWCNYIQKVWEDHVPGVLAEHPEVPRRRS